MSMLRKMAAVKTISQTNYDTEWVIGPAQKNKHGTPEHLINLVGGKTHPRIQPVSNENPMRTPFGISQYNEQGSLSINFSLGQNHKEVFDFFQSVDKWVLDWAWANKESIFSNKVPASREVLESMYTPLMSLARGDYEPLLRAKTSDKIPVWLAVDGCPPLKGTTQEVTPGSLCVPVLSIERLWIMSGRFGCTMRCQALVCHPRKEATFDELFGNFQTPVPAG